MTPTSWSDLSSALRIIFHPPNLRRTLATAGIVGTVLFAINQLDVVLRGNATPLVWLKIAVTYCVPFIVSNVGVLIGTGARGQP